MQLLLSCQCHHQLHPLLILLWTMLTETSPGSTFSLQHVAPNTHSIVTRSEGGFFKPKLYNTYLTAIYIEMSRWKKPRLNHEGMMLWKLNIKLSSETTHGLLSPIPLILKSLAANGFLEEVQCGWISAKMKDSSRCKRISSDVWTLLQWQLQSSHQPCYHLSCNSCCTQMTCLPSWYE